MSLLPSSPDVAPDGEPRVVGLDSEEADDLMAALSSTTARTLLAELHEEPAPPGELADRVDTSLQNAQYHLERLEDAGAIEVVGTAYSEKGREMRVYGPADSPLVIFAGEQERASGLRAALSRLFGGFAALALGSLAIQQVFGRSLLSTPGDDAAPAAGTETATPTATPADDEDAGAGDEAGPADDADDAEAEDDFEAFDSDEDVETTASSGSDDGADAADTSAETPAETATPVEDADAADGDPTLVEATETPTPTPTETPTPAGGDELDPVGVLEAAVGSGLPPGLAFFLGGATVLTLLVATTYLQTRP